MCTLVLAQLAGQGDDGEAAVGKARQHPVHSRPRVAEDERVFRLVVAQHVDDGVLRLARSDHERTVFDIDVLLPFLAGGYAQCIALVTFGQLGDGRGHGGGKHQRAAVVRRCVQHEFEVFAETEVEHLVGFIQHHDPERAHVEGVARDVVAQPSWRTDNDMRAAPERLPLAADIHTADAGGRHSTGLGVEPIEFALDLHCQFTGRGDHESKRRTGLREPLRFAQQRRRDGHAEGDRLAGPRLGGNEKVRTIGFRFQHGTLHGGHARVAALVQRARKCRGDPVEVGHGNVPVTCKPHPAPSKRGGVARKGSGPEFDGCPRVCRLSTVRSHHRTGFRR